MTGFWARLRCNRGFHFWNEEVEREPLKSTGTNLLFATSAIQKGVRMCNRCRETQKVYREGWCASGGFASQWKRLSDRKERYIDSLPVL